MAFELAAISIPIVIGLVGVAIAVLERAYKAFLEKQKVDPHLKFDSAYLLNALISTGIGTAIVTAVIPVVITEIGGQPEAQLTLSMIFLNFILGYAATYRILDALNDSTSTKIEIAELREEAEEVQKETQ